MSLVFTRGRYATGEVAMSFILVTTPDFTRPRPSHADPYTILGVSRAASAEDIRQAYRRMALASTFARFAEPTCKQRWAFYAMQRSYT